MQLTRHLAILFFCLYVLISHVSAVPTESKDTLQYLQILFRHGDRAPIHLYPTDPNSRTFWTEGLGKLTKLGRQQHYELGKYFRRRYKDFISTNPNEIDMQSSETDRCLKSALTNVATFYEPTQTWQFESGIDWQPISVLYVPKDKDKYLETDSDCPRAFEERDRIIASPKGQAIIRKYKEMFDNLTDSSGTLVKTWVDAAYLYDTLKIEKKYNLTIPTWATTYWEQLHYIGGMSFYWSFNSTLSRRLRAGPLLGKIIDNMESKVRGELPDKKVQVFSGHDTNVALLMQALNVANYKQPPYCSSLQFELHNLNGSYAVRILFLNSTAPEREIEEPHLLQIFGCKEFCPLDYFINYTADLIPEDWEAECKLDPTFFETISKTSIAVPVVFSVLAVGILVVSTYSVWKFQFRGQGPLYAYFHDSDVK